MTQELQTIDLKQLQQDFGKLLGLDHPVSESVLRAAVVDSTYANDLLLTRDNPKYQQYLLDNPPQLPQKKSETMSTVSLIASAAKSLVLWAKTGFSTVSEEIFEARLAACESCPHLRVIPSDGKGAFAYKFTNKKKICGKCGCPVESKARLSSEACPDVNLNNNMTRWNEIIK